MTILLTVSGTRQCLMPNNVEQAGLRSNLQTVAEVIQHPIQWASRVSLILKNDPSVSMSSHVAFFSPGYKLLINLCICNLLCYMRASLYQGGTMHFLIFPLVREIWPVIPGHCLSYPQNYHIERPALFLLKKPVFCNKLQDYVQSQHF
jgi:hypothetical protein